MRDLQGLAFTSGVAGLRLPSQPCIVPLVARMSEASAPARSERPPQHLEDGFHCHLAAGRDCLRVGRRELRAEEVGVCVP